MLTAAALLTAALMERRQLNPQKAEFKKRHMRRDGRQLLRSNVKNPHRHRWQPKPQEPNTAVVVMETDGRLMQTDLQ